MNLLVVSHTYVNRLAFDASNHRNHGRPYAVTPGVAPFVPSFAFESPDSRVVVAPSPSLQNLIAVRAVATFNLAPPSGIARRYNLIEGHLAFALFVESDGALMGTILDATGNWLGARSAPNVISTGTWHQAELRHDGINECVILLDGQVVARSYVARGPVRSVGPHGIAIGHWPETPGTYTFVGHIRAAEVYKYDPVTAAKSLLDPCCDEGRGALDQVADRLRSKGYTAAQARAHGLELMNFALRASGEVRGNDPVASQQQSSLSALALGAFLRHDSPAYTAAFAQLAALASARLTPTQKQQLHDEEEKLVAGLPLPIKDWQELIAKICLDKATVDPKQLASEYEKLARQEPRPHERASSRAADEMRGA
jgi:hypothetical protein